LPVKAFIETAEGWFYFNFVAAGANCIDQAHMRGDLFRQENLAIVNISIFCP